MKNKPLFDETVRTVKPFDVARVPRYSICTLVTRPDEYREMRDSFVAHGFGPDDTEYLVVDNSDGNRMDAFESVNRFLSEAANDYVIICHQDVLLVDDGRTELDSIIREMNRDFPRWGLLGNAGARDDGTLVIRISDPHGENTRLGGPFPVKAKTLDENFLLVRKDRNICVSGDLEGFHFYGTDICLHANLQGWQSFAVDFHLRHKSSGSLDQSYFRVKKSLTAKYRRQLQGRRVPNVNYSPIYVGSSGLQSFVFKVLQRLKITRFNHPRSKPDN